MPVTSMHKDYAQMAARWMKCRDVYDGSHAVKQRGEMYLPAVGDHQSNSRKYASYKLRALFFNAMRRTVQGLTGAIFQKELTHTAPELDKDLSDVTLTSMSLEMFALHATREVFIVGRHGILIDMAANGRPYWVPCQCEDIISWRTARVGGDEIITLVVLRETVEVEDPTDPFVMHDELQYRVLLLEGISSKAPIYKQRVYRQDAKSKEWEVTSEVVPTRRGKPLSRIPFVPVGPDGVNIDIQRPPLEDVADINISHYQSMADLEWGRHFTALPTPWVAGHAGKAENKLSIGSGVAWKLTEGGRAGMLEFTGKGLSELREADEQKRKLMATLGARLLEDQPRAQETATAVGMRHAGEHATLRTIAQSVEQALTYALSWHAWWGSTAEQPSDMDTGVELNKDFLNIKASPEEIKAALLLWQSGAISYQGFYSLLQRGEWSEPGIDADTEKKRIEKEGEEASSGAMPPIDDEPEPDDDDELDDDENEPDDEDDTDGDR